MTVVVITTEQEPLTQKIIIMHNDIKNSDDAIQPEEVGLAPNLFVHAFDNDLNLKIACPFMGFPWDGTSLSLHNLLIETCIDNKISQFRFGTLDITVIYSRSLTHPMAKKEDKFFVYNKEKRFIDSGKNLNSIIKYLY